MLSKEYLLQRGYCCGLGCLMCPYEPKHTEGNTIMSKKVSNELKIAVLEKKVSTLEKTLKEFMDNWGPEVQEARSRRDEIWDEMVRVVSIQKKHQQPKPEYDIHGNKWTSGETNEDVENH